MMETGYGLELPRRLQIEFSRAVQSAADERGRAGLRSSVERVRVGIPGHECCLRAGGITRTVQSWARDRLRAIVCVNRPVSPVEMGAVDGGMSGVGVTTTS